MTHYHANLTTSDGPDGLFAHEWQARAHLASSYVQLAAMALASIAQCDPAHSLDGVLDGEVGALLDVLRMADAVVSTEGTVTEHGQEWEDDGDYAWFDRCDKAECGTWTRPMAS
jgi:hypothetical protein